VLDIPAAAKGKYTVNLSVDETFMARPVAGGAPEEIPSLQENGFVVNAVTGSCCFALGTPGAGCNDTCVNRSDCAALPGPRVFSPGKLCSEGCVECTIPGNDPLCDDGDACTTETCNATAGVCVRGNVSGYAEGTCCDPATGALASNDDGDACTDDACSLGDPPGTPKPGNGTPTHTPSSATTPCDDENPCTTGDHCDGVRPEAAGGCIGTDVNGIACASASDCPLDPQGVPFACVDGSCFCTLTPNVQFVLDSPSPKTCAGGFNDGDPCGTDADCPGGGVCDLFADGANCFDEGEKVTATVNIGSAGSPINGGQLLMTYDPSCLEFNSVVGLAPYTTTVYGPIVNESAGTIFIAVGVDPFGGADGPLGNVDMFSLSFKKIGECNECDLCCAGGNPENSYLVDNEGQKVDIDCKCKSLRAKGDLVLDVPVNIETNVDCDRLTAVETWDPATASHSCATATLTCRGAHESGLVAYSQAVVLNGGLFPVGSSSFCCSATANDPCGASAGCAGPVNDCALGADQKPEGCWTVTVNDETSLDIDVQLSPPITHNDRGGELTRCITFSLFSNCIEDPQIFENDVTFGGLLNFRGKFEGKIKLGGSGQWDCITAQDQLHTLRSCYTFGAGDCVDGQLTANFTGDPAGTLGGWSPGWLTETVSTGNRRDRGGSETSRGPAPSRDESQPLRESSP
jgi:hypothetical protein